MKYRKMSYKASMEFFYVILTFGNTQVSSSPPKSSTSHLDTHGGSVTMARYTFLRQSLMCRYMVYPLSSGRKYCFSSLKNRKKNLSYEMKMGGSYTMRKFLSKTDPDFFPVDLQNVWIK